MQERWLSVEETAAHFGGNPNTSCRRITRETSPGHRLGRLWELLATEVDEWTQGGHTAENVPTPPAPDDVTKRRLTRH